MSIFDNLFKLDNRERIRYSVIREGEEESGVEWLVQIELRSEDLDDSFDSNYREEVTIVATDFDTAYKYAQQYVRAMQLKEATKDAWRDAEIISVDKI